MLEYHEHIRSEQLQSRTPLSVAIVVLVVAAGLASICTELVVGAIPSLIESWDLSELFLGLIVLPVVGNAAEHVTATKLALRNKMPLAKNVAIESSTYIILLVTPAIVLLGWLRGKHMSLHFEVFEVASVVLASVVASCFVVLGKSGWQQGAVLLSTFFLIAVGSLIYSELE